ncbi:hypothetical protein ERHA54_50100 (plasmid) [Erwinia rhapontici]|nr:hypothetical protein ERHA54_50100 [Erwinia rhapontici]
MRLPGHQPIFLRRLVIQGLMRSLAIVLSQRYVVSRDSFITPCSSAHHARARDISSGPLSIRIFIRYPRFATIQDKTAKPGIFIPADSRAAFKTLVMARETRGKPAVLIFSSDWDSLHSACINIQVLRMNGAGRIRAGIRPVGLTILWGSSWLTGITALQVARSLPL